MSLGAISLLAETKQDFDAFLRLVGLGASMAEPPWFAPPLEAKEDAESYMVAFHVADREQNDLYIQGNERGLFVWGRPRSGPHKREMRLCAFRAAIDPKALEITRAGDVLMVRARKKRRDRGAR